MSFKRLVELAKEKAILYPNHKEEILEFLEMAQEETGSGGSEDHECELAYESIKQLCGED